MFSIIKCGNLIALRRYEVDRVQHLHNVVQESRLFNSLVLSDLAAYVIETCEGPFGN